MKNSCYCHTCEKAFHSLGINRHRAMHRDKKEDCTITYTYGDTYTFRFSEKTNQHESREKE
jgi:hypothetical protein